MKRKQLLVSLFLAVTVLFSVLGQSVHTYEHFEKQFAETDCHHQYKGKTAQVTHQHHGFDDCKVCHFSLGSYSLPTDFNYVLLQNVQQFSCFMESQDAVYAFSGSLYAHRGPPINS